ncbi:MFS general substrate transporter [Aureobasidium pullulans EXF-150]|uniref:MFS general substrate transporter n=1 Tax=Aureobasidium pullulans EXF-150 TaxID=1043002 RepID=A0A074XUD7_AURPU|nr:MFS general substrate transporter [Aureobasidium pullulans EXF-150]KEQ85577.1 MFS general substrate transporter [Aureobasidium pullulans EXF-150]
MPLQDKVVTSDLAHHATDDGLGQRSVPILQDEAQDSTKVQNNPNDEGSDETGRPWSIWTPKQRKMIILAASFASLLSPLSSQIYLPALDVIAKDLHVTDSLINLSITTYVVVQGIAPTFTAQLSDTIGRRPVYMVCLLLYLAANLGLAFQNSYIALMVLRCLQSAGSSGTAALSYGVATDITTSTERGTYVSWAAAAPMLGPTLGPVIGGLLSRYAGWHSGFWFLVAVTCAVALPMSISFPETCRNVVGDGSIPPQDWNKCYTNIRRERNILNQGVEVPSDRHISRARISLPRLPNPFGSLVLITQRECGFALLYSAILCCSFYVTLSAIPSQFSKTYHFNELQIALCYIPFGIGSLVAAINRGRMIDTNFERHAKRLGVDTDNNKQTDLKDFPIERARLEVAVPMIILGSACNIGFGWTVQCKTNLAGPLILLFVIAFCTSSSLNCVACLMLDLYPGQAGTVTASNNLLRCLLGAGATAATVPLINAIGFGWAVMVFAILNVVALPLLWYVMREGPKWRTGTLNKRLHAAANH